MKNITYNLMLVALATSIGILEASQFRSPLSLNKPYAHWPSCPIQQSFSSTKMNLEGREDESWQVSSFATIYSRGAGKAFFNETENKNTRKETSLATLLFGKESFRGEEAFVNGKINNIETLNSLNAALGFAFITPVFDYNEQGAYFGIAFSKTLGKDNKWHVGARVSLPVVDIEVEQNVTLGSVETIDDVVRYRLIQLDEGAGGDNYEFAYRADFLSTLAFKSGNDVVPLLRLQGNNVMLAEKALSATTASQTDDVPAAYAIKRSTQTYPENPFRKTPDQVSGALAVDGTGTDNATYFFDSSRTYTNLLANRATLSTLYIVPRALADGTDITARAAELSLGEGIVSKILNQEFFILGSESVAEFFLKNNTDLFSNERVIGIGDMELEFFAGYGDKKRWFVDMTIGAKLPTGKKQNKAHATDPFYFTTGNNGHFELKFEVEGGYKRCKYFALKADASVHHVFNRTEHRTARFTGSTINNLGTPLDAKVSWTYFVGHFDFNLFHPYNKDLGMMIGYELFARTKDHIKYNATTATDLAGQVGTLDKTAAEARTNSMSHKIRGEFFHRWNYCELTVGLSHIVAGRSVMKETELHAGVNISF